MLAARSVAGAQHMLAQSCYLGARHRARRRRRRSYRSSDRAGRRGGCCRMAMDSPSVLRHIITSINIAQAVYVSQSAGAIGATTRFRDRAVRAISDRSLAPSVALSRRERAIPRLSSDVTWHGCDARRQCRSGAAARMACGSPSMAAQPRGTALLASARSGCATMAGQSLWKAGALVVGDMRWWGVYGGSDSHPGVDEARL